MIIIKVILGILAVMYTLGYIIDVVASSDWGLLLVSAMIVAAYLVFGLKGTIIVFGISGFVYYMIKEE